MSSKLCVVFDFLELPILDSQPICRSRFRFCTLLTNSELSQLERMLITLRLSGLSRVVSEQMSARRQRAGALRYCQLDDWVVPTSFYLVEKVTVRTYG